MVRTLKAIRNLLNTQMGLLLLGFALTAIVEAVFAEWLDRKDWEWEVASRLRVGTQSEIRSPSLQTQRRIQIAGRGLGLDQSSLLQASLGIRQSSNECSRYRRYAVTRIPSALIRVTKSAYICGLYSLTESTIPSVDYTLTYTPNKCIIIVCIAGGSSK